jgi:hypothetical protein
MGLISNSQSFYPGASGLVGGTALENSFKSAMDSVLVGLGRDITIHLPAAKSECPAVNCDYNSTYDRFMGTNGKICETCRGQGFVVEPRWTIYRANIRWTEEPYNEAKSSQEKFEPGRLGVNFVRTKMVASAFDHIKQSIGATIDGVDVELHEQPRTTGFGNQVLYTVCWWKVVNR